MDNDKIEAGGGAGEWYGVYYFVMLCRRSVKCIVCNKPIGASPRRDYRSDEDGTILAHNILGTRFRLEHRKRGERSAGSG